jgi:hypothetical protein
MKVPATLIEAVAYFADPQLAHDFFAALRWPNGAACPRCGNAQVRYWPKYRRWNCGDCRRAVYGQDRDNPTNGRGFECAPENATD